jgi:hypothetical protein
MIFPADIVRLIAKHLGGFFFGALGGFLSAKGEACRRH